ERALVALVAELEKTRCAVASRPRALPPVRRRTRHIPAAVRREVVRRDGGQCPYVGTEGRCTERGLLELHHVVPIADGGAASVDNLQLRCRAHNQHEAMLWLGCDVLREARADYEVDDWVRTELHTCSPSKAWGTDLRHGLSGHAAIS